MIKKEEARFGKSDQQISGATLDLRQDGQSDGEIDEEPKEKKPRGRPHKDGVAKERKPRQCPDIKAKDAGFDAEETGLDGATWKVFARPKSGHLFWKRV